MTKYANDKLGLDPDPGWPKRPPRPRGPNPHRRTSKGATIRPCLRCGRDFPSEGTECFSVEIPTI